MRRREWVWIACCLVALVYLNAYWCRQVFFLDHIGHMNSVHGLWMGFARLAHTAWHKPTWWRYSYDGMPFEFTYAPLVPGLIAGISRLTGCSLGRAFDLLAGFVFCFGPVAMFLMAREVTRRTGWSFVATLAYCLITPSQLVAPDAEFALRHLRDARRITLTFVWDDVPHELALALVMLAILFLVRGLRQRKTAPFLCAGVFIALAMLTNAFGVTTALIFMLCLLVSWDSGDWKRNAAALGVCGLLAYFAMCPFLPPSLIAVIRRNANLSSASGWSWVSAGVLATVAGVGILLWSLSRHWSRHVRFFLFLAWVFSAIPILAQWNLHFLPQPERYKVEMDMGLTLLFVFAAAPWVDRTPRLARVALAVILLFPAAAQVREQRRYAKNEIRWSDVHQTIEYQVAMWLRANLSEGRVMAPGTIGIWMNAFTSQQQFMGGAFTTLPTVPIQHPIWGLQHLEPSSQSVPLAMLWLQAYGVDALVVPGPESPEYWKPFHLPQQFGSALPLLWRERDTSIYAVPRTRRGLAHVIPASAVVRHEPPGFFAVDELRAYVAAVENPASPAAEWRWIDDNHGKIRETLPPGAVTSLQINYHPGWKAFANGRPAPIERDGLAQMVIRPNCNATCEIDLMYDGGPEAKLCRALSLITILVTVFAAGLPRRIRPASWGRTGRDRQPSPAN